MPGIKSGIKYRRDIDGLRAVAVLSVFAFHLGLFRFARGGFVGVDIFFVISGYLITQIIARQIRAGSFSIAGFYRRRALRILPACFVMLMGAAAGSLLLLPPVEVMEFGRSAIAASFSVSNFFFYFSPSGYFFDDLNAGPLLHTWSLGVEEQFYVLFPLALVAVHRWWRAHMRYFIAAAGLVSFAISLWALRHDPQGAFFLLPSRFWELMLGGAAALGILPVPQSGVSRQAVAATGALMIAGSVLTTDGGYLPYYWAVLPCVGAVMIILAGETGQTAIGRLLSLAPMVWIGLISYSLYLWHWPVIVFDHVGLIRPLNNPERAIIFSISVALAVASYFLVERPFRNLPRAIPSRRILSLAGMATAAVAAAAALLVSAGGFPGRFSSGANAVSAYLDARGPDRFRSGTCFISKPDEHFDWNACLGPSTGARQAILFGDSHAAALYPALQGMAGLRQVTATYCRPLLDLDRQGLPFCTDVVEGFFQRYLAAHHSGDVIIFSERWQAGQEGAVRKTIHAFLQTGARVVLIGPTPEYFAPLPRLEFAKLTWTPRVDLRAYQNPSLADLDARFAGIAAAEGISFISPMKELCPRGDCSPGMIGGAPILSDTDHLTPAAAGIVAGDLKSQVARLMSNSSR